MSKCPNCNSTSFESVKATIKNNKFPMLFIRCSICEVVVGTEPAYYTPQMLQDLAKSLNLPPLP